MVCSFPFEYKATILYGQSEFKTKVNITKGMSSFSSFYSIAARDLVFTAVFWPVVERSKVFLREYTPFKRESVVMPLSSIIGCLVSGTLTYPMEFVKTMRVTYELEYKHKNFLTIFKDVYSTSGCTGLCSGIFFILFFIRFMAKIN